MSFTIERALTKSIYYPEIGVQTEVTTATLPVTYTVIGIKSLYGTLGVAIYKAEVEGASIFEEFLLEFNWTGELNTAISEAEAALQESVTK